MPILPNVTEDACFFHGAEGVVSSSFWYSVPIPCENR